MSRWPGLLVLLAATLAFASAGCATSQPALAGSSWDLTAWAEPTPIPSTVSITAAFDQTTVSGSSGVNTYHAQYTSSTDGSISITHVATTLMAGPAETMNAEKAFVTRLQAARGYRVDGDRLVLLDADGKDSLTFIRVS
jgi:heat shock protein HslJ